MHIILDADPIVYRGGFAAERAEYHIVYESPAGPREVHFAPDDKKTAGDRMRAWYKKHPDVEILDKERVVYPEPVENALEATRTQINSIFKEVRDRYGDKGTNATIILSGPGNFREALATIAPYKGNRDPDHKPTHYQAIRDLLTGEYAAKVVHGREADDECSIIARGMLGKWIIATIDKDLDQIPGLHYNYMKQVFHDQPAEAALLFFYQQALSGDPTDGIPGCWKVGEIKAKALIEEHWNGDEAALWEAIVDRYAASFLVSGCPYHFLGTPEAIALETARLVKLQEYPGQLWNPPGIPHGQLPEETQIGHTKSG